MRGAVGRAENERFSFNAAEHDPAPRARRPKIVAGRVAKLVKAMALMEQPYIKDPEKTVATVVKEATATIGEKISVRRFSRCACARRPSRTRARGWTGGAAVCCFRRPWSVRECD
jgi:translation elongation factor EF-Ts